MNTALLEELLRKKAQQLHSQGLTVAEAIDRAGDEIFNCMAGNGGHGSRFCLRMVLNGAKKRVSPESCGCTSSMEGDKSRPIPSSGYGQWKRKELSWLFPAL